jgi:hypothetical protein
MKKRFRFLRTLANIFKIIGVIISALSLLSSIILLAFSLSGGEIWSLFGYDPYSGVLTSIAFAVLILVVGVLAGLFDYGLGELIYLLLSIEENAYQINMKLEQPE